MALTDEESFELLEFLRTKVRSSRYQRLDDAAISRASSAETPFSRLATYLETLINTAAAESGGIAQDVESRLGGYLATENGEPFLGVEIELSPYDRDVFSRPSIPLRELNDASIFVSRLRNVLDDLHFGDEPDFSR